MKVNKAINAGSFKDFLIESSSINLVEAKNFFAILQKNKVRFTKEERSEVMTQNAVWHRVPNGEETPAIWKSKKSEDEFVYVTHTHRAYNTAINLKSAILKFHNFIKSTT